MVAIAPPARIERRTERQRRFLPRLLESVAALRRGADDARLPDLRAALWRSPYYVERLREAGLSPEDLQSLDDLKHFPLLDRATLARRWRDLPAAFEDCVVVKSSGTTGDPVNVVKDGYDCVHMWAVLRYWLEELRIEMPRRPRVVLLDTLPGGLEYSARLPLFFDGALHRISTLREDAFDRLERAKPSVVFTDPAGIHWLGGRLSPPLLLSSAQHLPPTPGVLNYYSTTETGPIAWEWAGRWRVLSPDVWVESVDGELVVTRLRPSTLPLLRYRTGDRGGVGGGAIEGFTGRAACEFVTPEGRRVDAWQLAWLFKHVELRSFRLVQTGPSAFLLESDVEVPRLSEALRVLGWKEPGIERRPLLRAASPKPAPFERTWPAEAPSPGFAPGPRRS
jgi:phenylacetate-CoA ligase